MKHADHPDLLKTLPHLLKSKWNHSTFLLYVMMILLCKSNSIFKNYKLNTNKNIFPCNIKKNLCCTKKKKTNLMSFTLNK